MSAELERKLRDLAPRLQRFEELKAERDRQRAELATAEEMLKQLKWTAYQSEQAYVAAEERGGGFFGIFSGAKTKNEELFQAAAEARETYDAAKKKVKPLREELANLERDLAELESVRPEYEAALKDKARAAAALPGLAGGAAQRLQDQLNRLMDLAERGAVLHRRSQKLESMLHRCDRSTLFTIRAEITPYQKDLAAFILEGLALPAAWNLPPLPNEADVRMMEPVGAGSKIHAPDTTQERIMEVAVLGHAFNIHQENRRMRAIVKAGYASDETVSQQARFQSILIAEWGAKIGAFAAALNRMKEETHRELEALVAAAASPAPEPRPAVVE